MLDLSVIVPFGGTGDASLSLASLGAQAFPRGRFEIIFVHETSLLEPVSHAARNVSARLLQWRRPPRFAGHSAGCMRNAAASLSRSRRLLFVDADCLVGPETLAIHAEAPSDRATVICGGVRELPATFPTDSIRATPYNELQLHALYDSRLKRNPAIRRRRAHWLELYSGNLSIPRSTFWLVDGFDENGFRCHDTDLGYRLSRRRIRLVYAADAEVIHLEHPRAAASRLEQAEGWHHLARKYPELREVANAHVAKAIGMWRVSVTDAAEKFAQLTSSLPGRLFGTMWLLPSGFPQEHLLAALGSLPRHTHEVPGATEYYLGLNRNCWDFSLVRPKRVVPIVTVAIPVHNGAATIERALGSVFAQTRQDFEIVVVDDASDDGTAVVAAHFANDVRLRVVSLERNRGMCHALNAALDLAAAPLMLQLDADDWLEPNALATMCEVFARDPECGAAYCDAVIHRPDGRTIVMHGKSATIRREILECGVRQVARTYRRGLLERCGGWPTSDPFRGRGYYEDRLMLASFSEVARVRHVPIALYHASESPHSLGRQSSAAIMKFIMLQSEAMRDGMSVATKPGPRALACKLVPRRVARAEPCSVVIPCHGRPELLRLSLLTWLAAGLGKTDEIIVVDDGSPEPLQKTTGVHDDRVRYMRLETRLGAPAARNRGAARSRHPWLFFSDGDHLVPPDILQVHAWYHGCSEDAIVTGAAFGSRTITVAESGSLPVEWQRRLLDLLRHSPKFHAIASLLALRKKLDLIPTTANGTTIWRDAWRTAFYDAWLAPWAKPMLDGTFDLTNVPHAWLRVGAGNLSMRRSTWASLRGFDEKMTTFEDWDLGARFLRHGGRILVNADSEPLHQAHPRDLFRPEGGWRSARRFARKHPHLITALCESKRDDLPPGGQYLLEMLTRPESYFAAPLARKTEGVRCAALTFDDGPHPVVTPAVLKVLRDYDATGTFFVTGLEVARAPDVLRRVFAEGHEIGVHGWSHEPPSSMDFPALRESLWRTIDIIECTTGSRPRWARAPYGLFTPAFRQAADALDLSCAGWDVTARDWAAHHSKAVIQTIAIQGISGSIIGLHDGSTACEILTETVRWICATCREGGLFLPGLSAFAQDYRLPPSELSEANAFPKASASFGSR